MKTHLIQIPKGIQFISNWEKYKIPKNCHCIVDKGVTGCGYTEFCLTNNENIVLVSPRKILMENKIAQHAKDKNIYYAENNVIDNETRRKYLDRIYNHIDKCLFEEIPCKILVSYDSLHYVLEVINGLNLNSQFTNVVDEFQSIFLDSFFKAEVELDFVEALQKCQNVIYLSATPMLDKYLEKLDQFKDLDFYKLDWSETGFVETIHIERKKVDSLTVACGKIVNDYLKGNFPITTNSRGEVIESKEAVFYLNSVNEITRVIQKYNLEPKNTRVICSDTPENVARLKKKGFKIGKVPLKGEENPMFMFCTSTSYIGVDFYSDNASSYVFADPNLKHLALDISLDLPQIVGRQRDKSNPFKNKIVVFYKYFKHKEDNYTKEDFDNLQRERKFASDQLLEGFASLTEIQKKLYTRKLKSDVLVSQYSQDFISISRETGLPVYNPLIEIANERAWEVSREDYQDNIAVTKSLEGLGYTVSEYNSVEPGLVESFLDEFNLTGIFKDRMKLYCEFRDKFQCNPPLIESLNHQIRDVKYSRYYEFFGTKGCSARGYRESNLKNSLRDVSKSDVLNDEIFSQFNEGDCFTNKELKSLLSEIYSNLGISKTAKASDLGSYFELIPIKVPQPDKTRENGFRLGKTKN